MEKHEEWYLIQYADAVITDRGVDEIDVQTVLRLWGLGNIPAALEHLRIADEEAQQGKEVTK